MISGLELPWQKPEPNSRRESVNEPINFWRKPERTLATTTAVPGSTVPVPGWLVLIFSPFWTTWQSAKLARVLQLNFRFPDVCWSRHMTDDRCSATSLDWIFGGTSNMWKKHNRGFEGMLHMRFQSPCPEVWFSHRLWLRCVIPNWILLKCSLCPEDFPPRIHYTWFPTSLLWRFLRRQGAILTVVRVEAPRQNKYQLWYFVDISMIYIKPMSALWVFTMQKIMPHTHIYIYICDMYVHGPPLIHHVHSFPLMLTSLGFQEMPRLCFKRCAGTEGLQTTAVGWELQSLQFLKTKTTRVFIFYFF